MPGSGPVSSRFSPSKALSKVDLPAFGRPTTAMLDRLGRIELAAVLLLEGRARSLLGDSLVSQFGRFGHGLTKRSVEIGQPFAMFGRQRNGVAEAEIEGFIGAGEARLALGLVGHQDGRLAGAANEAREVAVGRHHAAAAVGEEEDRVGLRHRGFGLRPHAAVQRFGLALVEARRVDHGEAQVAQARIARAAIARHARAGRRRVRASCRRAG